MVRILVLWVRPYAGSPTTPPPRSGWNKPTPLSQKWTTRICWPTSYGTQALAFDWQDWGHGPGMLRPLPNHLPGDGQLAPSEAVALNSSKVMASAGSWPSPSATSEMSLVMVEQIGARAHHGRTAHQPGAAWP